MAGSGSAAGFKSPLLLAALLLLCCFAQLAMGGPPGPGVDLKLISPTGDTVAEANGDSSPVTMSLPIPGLPMGYTVTATCTGS